MQVGHAPLLPAPSLPASGSFPTQPMPASGPFPTQPMPASDPFPSAGTSAPGTSAGTSATPGQFPTQPIPAASGSFPSAGTSATAGLDSKRSRPKSALIPTVLRTADVVTREVKALLPEVHKQFPLLFSPCDADSLKQLFGKYCKDVTTGGGGHRIYLSGTIQPTRNHGGVQRLACSDCKKANGELKRTDEGYRAVWEVKFESISEGWALSHAQLTHANHELCVTAAEVMATGAGGRDIPPDFMALGRLLAMSSTPGNIMKVFADKAREDSIDVVWTYQDIWRAFAPSREQIALDATGYLDLDLTLEDVTITCYPGGTPQLSTAEGSETESPNSHSEPKTALLGQ